MMKQSPAQLWERFQAFYSEFPNVGLSIDLSRTVIDQLALDALQPKLTLAVAAMKELESGAIANPDENRMVGHYWLRRADLAPTTELRQTIKGAIEQVQHFAAQVHNGKITAPAGPFQHVLIIGIGGSALGPQFIAQALGGFNDKVSISFLDNTDPDGMDKVLDRLRPFLSRTLVLVISKSGGTKETRNGMLEAKAAFEKAGLLFPPHAVAITGEGSELDKLAIANNWLARFPMWDWVGGRTSVTSTVGLVPMALQGVDIQGFLQGAGEMDQATRQPEFSKNPALQLAAAWYIIGEGRGAKDMVILPYKDRLELFSKYLQQLLMESLGKELDLDGNRVNQGIAVYGNKGSTDQHAYIQQLRDGLNNFFVTFIEVLQDRRGHSMEVDPTITSGDYLQGFFLGTREALYGNGRQSITLTIPEVTASTVGGLIALYERAVGFYASLINVNAYHQPGVEAGKKAAGTVIDVKMKTLSHLQYHKGHDFTSAELANAIAAPEQVETVFKICERLSYQGIIGRVKGTIVTDSRYHSL